MMGDGGMAGIGETDYAIQIEGLAKSFKDNHVLKGVSLSMRRGSIFCLLGSDGASKTTVVNILSTLMRPDGGTASVCGHDVATDPVGVRRSISLTGQFAAVDAILSGRENLALIARLRGERDPKAVSEGLLRRFGLTEAADRRASTYSGGMARRLDIAMSLIGSPKVIFLDEPTTGLDPEARIEVWNTVKELSGGGTTIMLTTQHLEEAEQLADEVAILHGGRIIACGTTDELRRLHPPAKKEYVEKLPTLEDIFLTIIGSDIKGAAVAGDREGVVLGPADARPVASGAPDARPVASGAPDARPVASGAADPGAEAMGPESAIPESRDPKGGGAA